MPIGDVIVWVGKQFLGSPYAAHTLEQEGEERLVVNLRGFDCVTFVESVVALAQCIRAVTPTFDAFKNNLRRLRYRDGVVDGYASRLHYFSEWLSHNNDKGIARQLTASLGGEPVVKTINWMTNHRTAYKQLADRTQFEKIAEVEKRRAQDTLWQIPKSGIHEISEKILQGDIIAYASNRSGLDVDHAGIAVRMPEGTVHMMHASDVLRTVLITREPLEQYTERLSRCSGIMISRPENAIWKLQQN